MEICNLKKETLYYQLKCFLKVPARPIVAEINAQKEVEMSNGLVYILTNPCLAGWIKIGMTERNDIERRLTELNAPPNIPLSYRCYATYEVEEPYEVEQHIHNLIDMIDDSLHAREELTNGRIREREFFKISPEKAYGIFKTVASLRGDADMLKLYIPTEAQAQEQEIAEYHPRRSNNSFALLGIDIGEKITFLYDETIAAEVIDNKNRVKFNDKIYTVSGLAKKILIENFSWQTGIQVNGWRYFAKDGKSLSDLREAVGNPEEE